MTEEPGRWPPGGSRGVAPQASTAHARAAVATAARAVARAPPKLASVPKLRIALAQVNSTVGDLAGNAQTIIEWTRRASARGADLVLFPEMMLTGYPVEDLALRDSFVDASIAAIRDTAARLAAEGLGGIAVVAGYLDRQAGLAPRTGQPASAALDAAALLHGGDVVVTTAKHHLPNYGVFDEYRYFVPGNRLPVFRLPCGPVRRNRAAGHRGSGGRPPGWHVGFRGAACRPGLAAAGSPARRSTWRSPSARTCGRTAAR